MSFLKLLLSFVLIDFHDIPCCCICNLNTGQFAFVDFLL